MKFARMLIVAGLLAAIVLSVAGCDKLALTGPKKYKVDLMNHLQNIVNSISQDGVVSDKQISDLEKFMSASKAEFEKNGSYVRTERILADLKTSQTDEATRFRIYQSVQAQVESVILTLQTEIPD